MKQLRFLLYLLFASVLFTATSCSKEDEEEPQPVNESQVLATYLESTNSPLQKDYVNTDLPSIMPASEVKTLNETGQVYIIDLRSATDFAAGHIQNAHNIAVADLINHMKTVNLSAYTKIALVCYTGQTAGFAASVLRLLGYGTVYSMKWGMCSWNAFFASKWQTAVANGNTYATQFTATAANKNGKGMMPTLSTGKTTGQEILEARASAILTEGFTAASVSSQILFNDLSSYYIVNYWPADQYADPGHIPGAIQYTPKESMKLAVDLTTLPTDKAVAVYCYTGQTSAFLVAYLRLLGYDAKSVLYGTNGMIYDMMVARGMTVFTDAQIMGYDYVQ